MENSTIDKNEVEKVSTVNRRPATRSHSNKENINKNRRKSTSRISREQPRRSKKKKKK